MPNDDDFATLWLDKMSIRKEMVNKGRVEATIQGSRKQVADMRQAISLNVTAAEASWAGHDGRRRSVWLTHCWMLLLSAMSTQCT